MIRKLRRLGPDLLMQIAALSLLAFALGGCGGGGSAQPIEGSRETRTISSRINGTTYPLSIYLPPTSAGPRSALPVIYALDGESWFDTLVDIAESSRTRAIIVAIQTAGQRNRDFVPPNSCTPNGGGEGAYVEFLKRELIPYVEAEIGGNPTRRTLFGHSHGGSLVLYAMFSEAPGAETFGAYLASDSSVSCMPAAAYGWEQAYAAIHSELPVRLHLSYATQGNYAANREYAQAIAQRNYAGLVLQSQAYTGTHGGIVPLALADAIAFALANAPPAASSAK